MVKVNFLKSCNNLELFCIDNSIISNTLWLKNLANVNVFGLFLLFDEKTINELSFFSEKNSKLEASSKGLISFFFENFLTFGFFNAIKSHMASCKNLLPEEPGTNKADLVFSTNLDSFLAKALFERAVFGLLLYC